MKFFGKYIFYFYNNSIITIIKYFMIISSSIFLYKSSFHIFPFRNDYEKFFIPNTYRLAFIFGTRPEAIKLFPLIKELKHNKNFICIIINTGQHKEMISQILKSLQMDNLIDFNLNIMKNNQSLASLTAKMINELEKLFNLITPNAVIIQGDTTTGFSSAVSAFYQKIPIFHVEAGLRTHNIYFPFPEEFNRMTIDDISTLYFAPTVLAAGNLIKENKNSSNIFVTGNTIVDSLQLTFNYTSKSRIIKDLINKAKSLCISKKGCKIILLTCHRRENYFKPIYNILKAVQELLKIFHDIVVVFPFHLNPNIQKSIKDIFPKIIYDKIINGKNIKDSGYLYLNRFLIIPPLNYVDLLYLELESYFIMTDSGGIQEEAASIGKPLLILRKNTERPEVVNSGCAFLTADSFNKIVYYASLLIKNEEIYKKLSNCHDIYGKGNSRFIISEIIKNYFKNNKQNSIIFNNTDYYEILSQIDKSKLKENNFNFNNYENDIYDIVIVLTVWKRNNLERQLIQIKNQSILKNKKTNIIIFQNSNHVDIDDIVNYWKMSNNFVDRVNITFIHSPIETGYFGRFIIPLTSSVNGNSVFFICDDDIIWGNRYFENMLRVVNEGSLCTRNGRIITDNYKTISVTKINGKGNQVCFNEDIEYDFGGHIWAGRISWLRKAWNHIPYTFENCEDFWISAVLKRYYNISTKVPKCPCPDKKPIIPELCAAGDNSTLHHKDAKIGNLTIKHSIRRRIFKLFTERFNYKRLNQSNPEYVKDIYKKYKYGYKFFNLSDSIWRNARFWLG